RRSRQRQPEQRVHRGRGSRDRAAGDVRRQHGHAARRDGQRHSRRCRATLRAREARGPEHCSCRDRPGTERRRASRGHDEAGRVGEVTITALGFEAERRRLAERLGVDPYTTNLVLSERLTDVAWVAFSGRAGIQALFFFVVPYSGAMTAVSATNRAVWDTPAGGPLP